MDNGGIRLLNRESENDSNTQEKCRGSQFEWESSKEWPNGVSDIINLIFCSVICKMSKDVCTL